jgi:hypothetical protein
MFNECPFRRPHLRLDGIAGKAVTISTLEVVDGDQQRDLAKKMLWRE